MTLSQDELFQSNAGPTYPRVIPKTVQPKQFASGSGTIPKLALLAVKTSTGFWVPFDADAGTDEVSTVTANATPATDGTFTLSVEGEETVAIDHDAAPAAVLAALEGLEGIDAGDVAVAMTSGADLGDSSAVMQITFQGNLKGKDLDVAANFAGLTGNTHVLAEATAGVDADGVNVAKGFVWDNDVTSGAEAITLDASNEIMRSVMLGGQVHRDDVPLNGQTQAAVDAALVSLRDKGFVIEGLDGFGS